MLNMEEGGYRWEGGYEKTWEGVVEDEAGSVEAGVLDLIHKAKRRRIQERQKNTRLGIMRHVYVILDTSKSMALKDFVPYRIDVALSALQEFTDQFYDQNPIGQLGLITTKDKRAERVTELSGNARATKEALNKLLDQKCSGEPSLQNALNLAMDSLKHIPTHSCREVVILMSSLTTCDPGNILHTIELLKQHKIKCSVVGMSAEVRVYKLLTTETKGQHSVMVDESHLKELLLGHALPPPCAKDMDSNLIRMGFPVHRVYHETSSADSDDFGSMLSMCAW